MYFFPKQEARRKRIRDVCKDKFATDPAWREAYREAAQQREEEIFVERTKYGNAVEGKHISHMCHFFFSVLQSLLCDGVEKYLVVRNKEIVLAQLFTICTKNY